MSLYDVKAVGKVTQESVPNFDCGVGGRIVVAAWYPTEPCVWSFVAQNRENLCQIFGSISFGNYKIKIHLAIFLLIGSVQCRRSSEKGKSVLLTKVAQMIQDKGRRNSEFGYKDLNVFLRSEPQSGGDEELINLQNKDGKLVEQELIGALAHKKSALLDKPYIETQGKNDFLVLHPAFRDPFVTIIPNMMYYNIEKKCVNWLDDCNLHGMKARLLREVQSPYKK